MTRTRTFATRSRLLVAPAAVGAVLGPRAVLAQDATPTAMDNEAIARAWYEPFNTGDTAIWDIVLAEDWLDIPMNPGQAPGREGFKPIVAAFRTVFPDLRITNEDVIVANDKVTVRSTISGTHQGEFLGITATGTPVVFTAIDIHRIESGQIVETWHVEDYLSLLFQLGATIQPPAATPAP